MAKKKTVRSSRNAKKKSVTRLPSNSVPVQGGQLRALSIDEIGEVAGEVWQLLTDTGNRSLTSIKQSIDAPDVLVTAAVGWLARENKLQIDNDGRYTKISLR